MFGSVCSGRAVQLAQQVDTNKYAITIENGSKISHVAIFLLPEVQLDTSFAALIYFQLPNKPFKLFGAVSSTKPSAIFKLKNNDSSQARLIDDVDMDADEPENSSGSNNIVIGISIETTEEAERLLLESKQEQAAPSMQLTITGSSSVSPSDPNQTAILASKIVKHAYNYLGSFIDDEGKVSIRFFDSWWDKFRTRLQNDPKFLDNQDHT